MMKLNSYGFCRKSHVHLPCINPMASSSTNTTATSSSPTTNNVSSLDPVRQMLLLPPAVRPPEFENPLEKIEQLLTCPICLDRYK